jgi:tetratricopeptide (TPR) repeat protein
MVRQVPSLLTVLLLCAAPNVLAQSPSTDQRSAYDRARELYDKGPARANEVIALLKEEIAANPKHARAHYLLGVTYFGTKRLDDALVNIRRAIELARADGSITPLYNFYEAKTLFHMGRCSEAKRILEAYWAFWQDGASLQKRYEELYPQVLKQCCREADSACETPRGPTPG